jgi:hypothetical protein
MSGILYHIIAEEIITFVHLNRTEILSEEWARVYEDQHGKNKKKRRRGRNLNSISEKIPSESASIRWSQNHRSELWSSTARSSPRVHTTTRKKETRIWFIVEKEENNKGRRRERGKNCPTSSGNDGKQARLHDCHQYQQLAR